MRSAAEQARAAIIALPGVVVTAHALAHLVAAALGLPCP